MLVISSTRSLLRLNRPAHVVIMSSYGTSRHGRSVVEASWIEEGHGHSDSVEIDSYEQARLLADSIADQLAAGTPPDLSRD